MQGANSAIFFYLVPFFLHIDPDQGGNSDVTMTVEWPFRQWVSLFPSSFRGREEVSIVLQKNLDYETRKKIKLKVSSDQ